MVRWRFVASYSRCISSGSRSLRCEWRQEFISCALEGLTTGHGSISGNILHVVAETHSVDGPIDSETAIRVERGRNLAQGSTGMPPLGAPLMHRVIALSIHCTKIARR